MRSDFQRHGELNCRIVRADDSAVQFMVILCHGYGAPGDDLVPLAREIASMMQTPLEGLLFAFPEAPLELDFGGFGGARAWWHLDTEAIMQAQLTGTPRDLSGPPPPGLEAARNRLESCVKSLETTFQCSVSNALVGGFSQGAMLTTDWALRSDEAPATLAILSGTLVNAAAWKTLAPTKRSMPVIMSHGQSDPLLPFSQAEALHSLMETAGLNVSFIPFPGPHTITRQAIDEIAQRIDGLR